MGERTIVDGPLGMDLEEQQTMILRDQLEVLKSGLPLQPYGGGGMSPQTQIHIDVPNAADQLAPQFDDLIGAQREIATAVSDLGAQGRLVLENSAVQTDLLRNLDTSGRRAVTQRSQALKALTRSADQLGLVNTGIGTANRSLAQINTGVAGVNHGLSSLESSVCKSLGELGVGLSFIGDELAQTRMSVLDALDDMRTVFLWSHREQMWVRKQILDALQTPVRTEAYDTWSIGESCRIAGDVQNAIRMYRKSLDLDPSQYRNYFSLGLIHLNVGDVPGAMDYFNTASTYSADDPKAQAYSMMHLAKVEFFDGNFSKARGLLERAMDLDVTNLDVWYELSLCCLGLGDKSKALYYIKNLLHANPKYGLKIIGNTEFSSVMPEIRQILEQAIAGAV